MGHKVVCTNRKARYLYEIEEIYEAGIALTGPEVKSLRAGKGTLGDAYGMIRDNEAFLFNAHISPYSHADTRAYDPNRTRRLLLHKEEIRRLLGKTRERGLTLVPLQIYFKNGRAKVELGLGRGKKLYDKRETIKRRESDREMARVKKGRGA